MLDAAANTLAASNDVHITSNDVYIKGGLWLTGTLLMFLYRDEALSARSVATSPSTRAGVIVAIAGSFLLPIEEDHLRRIGRIVLEDQLSLSRTSLAGIELDGYRAEFSAAQRRVAIAQL